MLSLLSALATVAPAYSVFTHQQLIDLTWKDTIRPLLLSRFPRTSADDLEEAHAYAFGGCAIQDLGYYPFGKGFFSELTHYVRAGDFIRNLLRNARDVDEYAFALGALSHYVGDTIGHQDAINPATSIAFPKLAAKYGPSVTYDEAAHAHVRTEFAFDIGELARHRLAPGAYLRFVGLSVSRRLLEQAFFETYALKLNEVLGPEGPAIRSYGSSVRRFLPRVAYAETVIHRDQFPPDPDVTNEAFRAFTERIARADFQTVWHRFRRKPGIQTYLLAIFIRIVPKIGVLADLAIKIPNERTQDLYIGSVNRSVDSYRRLLAKLRTNPRFPALPNLDLDTGKITVRGTYALTDQTYSKLLDRVTAHPARSLPRSLQSDILRFYADPAAPAAGRKDRVHLARVERELTVLQQMKASDDALSNPVTALD